MANVLFLLIAFPRSDKDRNLYSDLVEEFAARGHHVYVATLMEEREGRETYVQQASGAQVLFVRCGNLFGVGPIRKALTTLSLPSRFSAAIAKHFAGIRFDLLLYPTPPITFAPLVRKLKREHNARTYLILRDIFPQNARDLGLIKDPFTFWFFRRKERQLYQISDYIGCMSQGNIDYILQHNSLDPAKAEILHNWERLPQHQPPLDCNLRQKYGIEGRFVAVFGGNIGWPQELEFLLQLAALYRDRQDIVFLIIGRGVARDRIARIIARDHVSNVRLLEQVPRDDYNQLLRACDIGLINLDRRFTIPNIPSKTASYFAAGLPILAAVDQHTDYGRILDDCQAGLWSITGDLPAYQRNFERLLNDPPLRKRLGENGRRALQERFTVEIAYQTIMHHFQNLNGCD